MDQERFDTLARAFGSGSNRRRVLGGVVAGLFGASAAKLADVAAKGKNKGKARKQRNHKSKGKGKKGKGGLSAQQIIGACAAATDPTCAGCCTPAGGGTFACVANGTGGLCGINGVACVPAGLNTCCSPTTGLPVPTPAGNCGGATAVPGTGGVCTPCPDGCCNGVGAGQGTCIQNGQGQCGINGSICVAPGGAQCCNAAGAAVVTPAGSCGSGGLCTPCADGCCRAAGTGEFGTQCQENGSGYCGINGTVCLPADPDVCCAANGQEFDGADQSVAACGSGGNLCMTCEGNNATCVSGNCQSEPPCPAGMAECDDICVNLGTNPSNCGGCGIVCPGCGKGRKVQCEGGACGCSQKRKKRKKRKKH